MGYNGTGSSAIVHLLKEYSNCCDVDTRNYEHNVFYAPHGLFDLEDVLLKNNTMYKCDAAIDDFYAAMKNLNDNDYGWFGGFQKRYGNKFMNIVQEFIDELVIYKRTGGWTEDNKYELRISYVIKDVVKMILRRDIPKFGYRINTVGDNVVRFAFPTDAEFYGAARKFVDNYYKMIGYESNRVFIFDQILEPQQLYRINDYFDKDVRFIVVDRDLRDMYLTSKYIWSKNQSYATLPTNADVFVNFYQRLLGTERYIEDERVLRIHFEDLIYKYDYMVDKIENFVGVELLGKHEYKKQFFNPDISIKNTQVFNSDVHWKKEVETIEKSCLKTRLYDFPYIIHATEEEFSDPNPDTSKNNLSIIK